MCTANAGRSTARISSRYVSGPSGRFHPIISIENVVARGFTASITLRQFSTVASRNSFERFFGSGPYQTVGIEGAGDVDAAPGLDGFGQRQPLGHIADVVSALLRVGIEHVPPGAHFGDDDLFRGVRLLDRRGCARDRSPSPRGSRPRCSPTGDARAQVRRGHRTSGRSGRQDEFPGPWRREAGERRTPRPETLAGSAQSHVT